MDDFDALLGISPPKPPAPRKPSASERAKRAAADTAAIRGPNAPPAPGKRRRGRPTKGEAAAHAAKKAAELAEREPDVAVDGLAQDEMPDATAFHRPVTRTFLATVLSVEPRRLVKRLANCPIVGWTNGRGGQVPLYDFKQAISYCVEPRIDIAQWIKSQNAMSLPPAINKAFWDAERSKQMVLERAKDLWRTADVLDVLGRTALEIKSTTQLWIENLPGKATLTTEQYDALRREVAALLDDIHRKLVEMPKERQTASSLREFEEMMSSAVESDDEVEND